MEKQYKDIEDMHDLEILLGLKTVPITVTFHDAPPEDISRVEKVEASGCTYWLRASEEKTFYTEAADHYNCPVGCFINNIELSDAQIEESREVFTYMYQLGYLTLDDVEGTPRREEPFRCAVYAPLSYTMDTPDVVIISGTPKQMMLLAEAATAAEVEIAYGAMGRPTCAIVPAVIQSGKGASSLGCVGNRLYTELPDDNFYFAFPGKHIYSITDKLWMIVNANDNLAVHYKQRKREIE